MENNQQVQKRRQIAEGVAVRLSSVPGISSIAVIGSVATGTATADSDIDLLVTYSATLDHEALNRVFDAIGRHPRGIATSDDPQIITTALLVEGVEVFPMIGPELYLQKLASQVGAESKDIFQCCFVSYMSTIVLYDPQAIWPGVIQAVRAAGNRHGILHAEA